MPKGVPKGRGRNRKRDLILSQLMICSVSARMTKPPVPARQCRKSHCAKYRTSPGIHSRCGMNKQLAASIHVAAVVQVKSFDKDKMTVDVQPLSKRLEQGEYQSNPPVMAVPIAVTRCNNWVVRPWFKEGDVGLLVYLDHDIDKVVDDGKESDPNTERNHSDSDAIFVGGIVRGQKDISDLASNGCPDESLALGSVDGKHWIAICEDKIQSQADLWQHEGDIEIKGDIDIEGDITVKGDVDITGDVNVYGYR